MAKKIDTTALKFNQASLVMLTLAAFLFDLRWLVLAVGLVLAGGTIFPQAALFKQIYLNVLKPAKLLKPNIIPDDPAPHRFAQGVGAVFLLASSFALLVAGNAAVGWTLAWVVIVLAAINLFFGFCAGCFVYFQLDRAGLLPQSSRR